MLADKARALLSDPAPVVVSSATPLMASASRLPTGILPTLALACTVGCASRPPVAEPGAAPAQGIEVRTYGSLGAIFDRGATRPVISLATLKQDPSWVGLGKLSGLRGEITIVSGEVWTSFRNDDGSSTARELGAGDETAAFLVASRVLDWQPVPLSESVAFADLADALEELVQRAGLDLKGPLPFLIEGALVNLVFSVTDGRAFSGESNLSREALGVSAAKSQVASAEGTLVGFFANAQHPEFLEPGTRLHLHVLLSESRRMGHVDHVDLPAGATVRLPLGSRSRRSPAG